MATLTCNDTELFYKLSSKEGIPLVFVHGSWVSHESWDLVVPDFAKSFRVLTYDRRGHSRSSHPNKQGSVREDVADLAALIEELNLAPAWVAGNSFGASIAIRLAGERPELFRGLIAHEPPLFSLLGGDPDLAQSLTETEKRVEAVVKKIESGDHAGAAEQFVETVALGPGTWSQMPPDMQQTAIQNAPTFLDESNDPEQFSFDPHWVTGFLPPSLLTTGNQSPPIFAPVIKKLADFMPNAKNATFRGGWSYPPFNASRSVRRHHKAIYPDKFNLINPGAARRSPGTARHRHQLNGDIHMRIVLALTLAFFAAQLEAKMTISVSTHLMFQGAADEAVKLYESVFPEFDVQNRELHEDGEMKGKLRLAHVRFGEHELIVFDSPPMHDFTFTPAMSLFVEFDDPDRLQQVFETLSSNGEVAMPLGDYGFSSLFGWLQDQFGVSWQLSLKTDK